MAGAIGLALGYLTLAMRELGMVGAGTVLFVMLVFYASRGRGQDCGWLLIGAGGLPALILGRNLAAAILMPSIEVGLDTPVILLVALLFSSLGALIVYASRR